VTRPLTLTRAQILAYRRSISSLDVRLPMNATSLRRAAWAGLQDSMPRAALLSIHARVEEATPSSWEHPSLAQVWGPRFSAYVVPARDHAIFTLGRLPEGESRRVAEDLATRLHASLKGRRLGHTEAVRPLGLRHPNAIRYATTTGRLLIRWAGAREPTLWTVPAPKISPHRARLELARRYLHVFGPMTAESFAEWAGIDPARGRATFDALAKSLMPVRTPIGDAWMLSSDEHAARAKPGRPAAARLIPSGDTFFLLQGADRSLLVPDAKRRGRLWTSRVWPGAVLVSGEVVGIWRRGGTVVDVEPWRRLARAEREAVEAEARSLPLPDAGEIRVRWTE
jgi:winged helix DNA-binding protein